MFNNKWLNESEMGDVTSDIFDVARKPYFVYAAKEMAEMTKWFINHKDNSENKPDSFSSF
jgi:hypothetical protein